MKARVGFVLAAGIAAGYVAVVLGRNWLYPETISGVPAGLLFGGSIAALASIIGFAVARRRRGQ